MIQHPAGPAVGETSRELRLAASVSRLLLPLYRLALHEPIGAFERQVLGLLREFIDFDSAWLGCSTLTPGGPSLHSSQTLDTAPDFVAEWEQCKADDPWSRSPQGLAGMPDMPDMPDMPATRSRCACATRPCRRRCGSCARANASATCCAARRSRCRRAAPRICRSTARRAAGPTPNAMCA